MSIIHDSQLNVRSARRPGKTWYDQANQLLEAVLSRFGTTEEYTWWCKSVNETKIQSQDKVLGRSNISAPPGNCVISYVFFLYLVSSIMFRVCLFVFFNINGINKGHLRFQYQWINAFHYKPERDTDQLTIVEPGNNSRFIYYWEKTIRFLPLH